MIFKGHSTKTSQMFLGKSLKKIIGQLHIFRNKKSTLSARMKPKESISIKKRWHICHRLMGS